MTRPHTLPLQEVRLVTLDLDDTLWPVRSVIERAEARLQDWLAEHCPATARQYPSESLRALRLEVERMHPELRGDFIALRKAAIRLALRRAGDPESHAEAAFAAFWSARHEIECFEDVIPALERLKSRFIVAAVTNGDSDIQRAGLGRYFDFTLSAEKVGAWKPSREIFRQACARAGVKPEQALHGGDDIDCDVRGALAVGMHAAWINRDRWSLRILSPPAITVPDLATLADRLCG